VGVMTAATVEPEPPGEGENTPVASYLPLELLSPIASGTGSPAMASTHRIYKAYPGLVYNIRCAVIGGSYPYTFALTNPGSGMTIDADTGEINWPNPQSNCTPTVTVTDSANDTVQGTWTIAVTTSGFKFIDVVNGTSGGSGAIGSPIRTLANVKDGAGSVVYGDILYFRAGTYTLDGANINPGYLNLGFNDNPNLAGRPMTWIAYPGETPVIDLKYGDTVIDYVGQPHTDAPYIRMNGVVYWDGITLTRNYAIALKIDNAGNRGITIRRCSFPVGGPGGTGGLNAAFVDTSGDTTTGVTGYGTVVQDCDFHDSGHVALKWYGWRKGLCEDNTFDGCVAGIATKAHNPDCVIRHNTYTNSSGAFVQGNLNSVNGVETSGEICYNFVNSGTTGYALNLGDSSIGDVGRFEVYRNSLIGRVYTKMRAQDGPWNFQFNAVQNDWQSGTPPYFGTLDGSGNYIPAQATLIANNATPTPPATSGVMDTTTGNLLPAYQDLRGTRGWEIP
jgi:hypothetical protein